jgi:hypothetical protein
MKTSGYNLIIFLILTSCRSYIEQPSQKFSALLKSTKDRSNGKLNFEGVYHQIKSSYHLGLDYKDGMPTRYVDTVYLDHPIFFFENGLMAYSNSIYLDSAGFNQVMWYIRTQQDVNINNWGVYEVKHDTIKATLYCTFSKGGYGSQRLLCHFEGIAHGRDTIYQWKIVPPYPNHLIRGDALDDLTLLKIPRDIYFKPVPIKQLIDPEKAWINEFKNESNGSKKKKK